MSPSKVPPLDSGNSKHCNEGKHTIKQATTANNEEQHNMFMLKVVGSRSYLARRSVYIDCDIDMYH